MCCHGSSVQDTLRGKSLGVAFSAQLLHDFGDRHGAEVGAAAHAQRGGLRRRLTVADDEHVGDLAQLGVADLGVHALAAAVHFDAQALRP